MGGDFNNDPRAVEAWIRAKGLPARVVAPDQATFHSGHHATIPSTIDFYVASADIAPLPVSYTHLTLPTICSV